MDYTSEIRNVWKKVIRKVKSKVEKSEVEVYPLHPDLHLPEGINEHQLFYFLKSVLVKDAPPMEMENYGEKKPAFLYRGYAAEELE